MRFVILGAGDQASIHARALQSTDAGKLVGVASANVARTQAFARHFGIDAFASPLDALNAEAIDAVIVATPTATHADLACQALSAGKHVFCETPISLTLAEADRMIDKATEMGRLLRIGLVHRFDAENCHVWKLLRSGSLGAPLAVTTSRLTSPFWLRPGERLDDRHHGDAIHELLAFDVEFLIWTFGMPSAVCARAVGGVGNALHVQACLAFDNLIAQCEASQALPCPYPLTLETRAVSERGFVRLKTVFDGEMAASGPLIDYEVHDGDGHVERLRLAPVNPWVAQLVDFMHAAQSGIGPSFASGEDGKRSLAVCLAIEEAARTGREIVL